MNERLGNNTNQKLLSGQAGRPAQNASQDVVIENVAERRYLWTARAFAVITAISLCCNFILILTINQIFPLYRIEPFLLTFKDKNEQVYHINTIDKALNSDKSITEALVREYVLLRSTFDTDISEMESRWLQGGPIQEMSSDGIYLDFINNTAKRAMEVIRKDSLTRDIRIITINEISDGIWQVEYEAKDMYPASYKPQLSYWVASLTVKYRTKVIKYSERMKNPIGFTVESYSLSRSKVN